MVDQAKTLGIELDKLKNIYIISDISDLPNKLENDLCKIKFDLIVIDTLADVFSKKDGDFYKPTDIRNFLNQYHSLAIKNKCCILFIHHTGKGKEKDEPHKNSIQGSQGIEAKMRTVIELRENRNDTSKRFLCITKGNYLSSEYKNEVFKLDFTNQLFRFTGERGAIENISQEKQLRKEDKEISIKTMLEEGKIWTEIQMLLHVSPSQIAMVKKKYFPTTTPNLFKENKE